MTCIPNILLIVNTEPHMHCIIIIRCNKNIHNIIRVSTQCGSNDIGLALSVHLQLFFGVTYGYCSNVSFTIGIIRHPFLIFFTCSGYNSISVYSSFSFFYQLKKW